MVRILSHNYAAAFTLIELLVTIAILAVLGTAVVVIINPAELVRQGRDSTRLSDLAALHNALGMLLADTHAAYFGKAQTVYVSLPDTTLSGTTTSTCSSLGLPALPSGYAYECHSPDTFRKVDGSGWLPVDLTQFSAGSPLSSLPVDPVNATSSGEFYSYVPGGSWELNGILVSEKYRNDTSKSKKNLPGVIAMGNDLSLSPLYNTQGLVGYWSFDEGTGTTAYDGSGNGNDGTLTNGPIWKSSSDCKVGGCIGFDGVDDWVRINKQMSGYFSTIHGPSSLSLWFQPSEIPGTTRKIFSDNCTEWGVGIEPSKNIIGYAYAGVGGGAASTGDWYHVVVTDEHPTGLTNTVVRIYINGQLKSSSSYTVTTHNGYVNDNPYGVGADYCTAGTNFNGLVDNILIYDHALSAAEVLALYNATR